mgnify:CR=1 FL=1
MKEIIFSGVAEKTTIEEKYNQLRENLQIVILKIIFDKNYFKNIVFIGGTALKIIYGLNRFSEDLDFSLENNNNFNFKQLITDIKVYFDKIGINCGFKKGGKGPVLNTFLRFPDLLYTAGISRLKTQNLNIKIEIDTKPPKGGEKEISLINQFYIFQVVHYNLSSLFAGKLHAILFRKYNKARDFYDLLWYLTKKVEPNYVLLNNAVMQTQKKDLKVDKERLKTLLINKINNIDMSLIQKDISKFIINQEEINLITKENFLNLIEKL